MFFIGQETFLELCSAHFKIETSSTVTVHTLIALYTTDDALVACDASLHEYRIFFFHFPK